ncbi:hypothetical protein ECC02_007309 [Trypanosoma cruzi]|uniref:Uncharacterized protein n=1 Tax=Trypanosoma cruzi TaxID=5693 RepID=A0A7J6XYR9_TRYCR|nr:hypothetical protein ECC02_007309 [Trypanosoma cruzi]
MKQSMTDSSTRDIYANESDTDAAYSTCDAAVVILQRCSGKKRERTPRFRTLSNERVSTEDDGHIDVVEHSNRLLEFLRVRRQQQWGYKAFSFTEDHDGSDEGVSVVKKSESRSAQTISSSALGLPITEAESLRTNGCRYCSESLVQESPSLFCPQVTVHSIATQTQAEAQSPPSESRDQMAASTITKADLLMLRLCELDALLHIFFS